MELKGVKHLQSTVKGLRDNNFRWGLQAERRAVVSGQRRAVRDIGIVLNLPAARIRRTVKRRTSSERKVFIQGQERENPPVFSEFGRGRFLFEGNRSAGYRVRIWRGLGIDYYKGGFEIPRFDFPYVREGPRRTDEIKPLYGPRIGYIFNQISVQLAAFMQERVSIEWRQSVRKYLRRRERTANRS